MKMNRYFDTIENVDSDISGLGPWRRTGVVAGVGECGAGQQQFGGH